MRRKAQGIKSNKLKAVRQWNHLTQEEVAEILGVKSAEIVDQWEKGTKAIGGENMIKLMILYQTMPEEVFAKHIKKLTAELTKKMKALPPPKRKSR